jgi:hypothetical protein
VRFQKFMGHNIMRSTKSKKVSILHYSIDYRFLDDELNDQPQLLKWAQGHHQRKTLRPKPRAQLVGFLRPRPKSSFNYRFLFFNVDIYLGLLETLD